MKPTFLFTDRIRSAAVNTGGAGVVAGAAGMEWPPWGDGNCDVDATSPTATHVEQDLDAWSSLEWSRKYPVLQKCN